PPLIEGGTRPGQVHLGDLDVVKPGPREHGNELVVAVERKRARHARAREGPAKLSPDGVQHRAQPWVLLARAPDRDDRTPTRTHHAPDLVRCALVIGYEHDPLATEDDVVAVVRLIDLLDIELDGAHVAEPAGLSPPIGDRRHLRGDIRENDLALRPDPLRS